MNESNSTDLLLDISILYRSTQKYYDKMLQSLSLTYAQLPILILIYEHEGISLQQIAYEGGYDKGTITKQVQKLQETGYIRVQSSKRDKRAKELYTTQKARSIMNKIYGIRASWWQHISASIPEEDMQKFSTFYKTMVVSAREFAQKDQEDIVFFDHQKLNVEIDPGKMSTIVWTGGCNFRCPFCDRSQFIFLKEDSRVITGAKILQYLKKRQNVLDQLVITGGEPLMHAQLDPFLREAKKMGYQIRIEINGSYPQHLQDLIKAKLVDQVVMSLKNTPEKYGQSIGVDQTEIQKIQRSVDILLHCDLDVRFTILPIKEFHSQKDLIEMISWLKDAASIELRTYHESMESIQKDLHGYTYQELQSLLPKLQEITPNIKLKGGSL
ncbi:anaerobic ribonucleoside-triphosphate reductase activating protein [Faecalicoccus acidiformans]|uniref:Anaerobic ribonucleoside-triphosphate reductase activating protein n=1 Tax=Faecalicoccus acidiformans TaxID=915173 RepID=A0ABS2FPG7_9FIRM|nr:anaerobic ribonucleoside-triphosphate reductase activating protein [Faecalicoccus acidiformans]MBM6831928.1 anaerobic ribonucleoside-triphosphate reductase activating protein [Faecalicoccus acidiformans]